MIRQALADVCSLMARGGRLHDNARRLRNCQVITGGCIALALTGCTVSGVNEIAHDPQPRQPL